MSFAHRNLDVYKRALESISLIARISNAIPDSNDWLAKQIRRSAGSILLNLGEGCGEYSPFEKARIIRLSKRSAFETADALQLVKIYTEPDVNLVNQADDTLAAVSKMLTKLAISWEQRGMRKSGRQRNE